MKIEKNKIYSVLTGDIVGSTKFKGEDRRFLHECFVSSSRELMNSFSEVIPYPPEFFRGDSWQFLITDPSKSLRIALFFRALLKSSMKEGLVDTRISIGVGSIEFLPLDKVSSGDGEAFRLSGRGLETIHKPHRMGVFLPDEHESNITKAFDIMIKLIDSKASEWTKKQAKAVCGALLGFTQEAIAKAFYPKEISQQAVSQHLYRAGWSSITLAVKFFEKQLPVILKI